jgi:hypothetical protein
MSSEEEEEIFEETLCYKHQENVIGGISVGICESCKTKTFIAHHKLCFSCSKMLKQCIRCRLPSFSGVLEQILPVVTYLVLEMNVPLGVVETYIYTAFISS